MAWRAYYVSVFSGIEAATVAWAPLGWEPVCFAEIDEFPSALLAERYPDVPNVGDVTKINWKKYRGKVDLVVGGSPCQSFSVAGKREGLQGESGLMFEYIRAVREIRPRWFLWENVPGALSSEGGEAFRQLLSEMDKLGYGLAWRVLDAQFFGVAQRRRRVFLVGHLGACPPVEVLIEPESMRGDYPSSREKREALAAATGRCASSAGFKFSQGAGAGSIGFELEQSPTCTADWHNPGVLAFAQNMRDEVRIQGDGTISGALSEHPGIKQTTYVCETAHTGSNGPGVYETSLMTALDTNNSTAVSVDPVICMADDNAKAAIDEDMCGSLKVGGSAPLMVANTLLVRCGKEGGGCLTPWDVQSLRIYDENGSWPALYAGEGGGGGHGYVFSESGDQVDHPDGDIGGIRRSGCGGLYRRENADRDGDGCDRGQFTIRRLTPRECERLQGFPDDWTLIPYRGEPADKCPDTPRYKALGNSMAVPVMRWIGKRIQGVMDREETEE